MIRYHSAALSFVTNTVLSNMNQISKTELHTQKTASICTVTM